MISCDSWPWLPVPRSSSGKSGHSILLHIIRRIACVCQSRSKKLSVTSSLPCWELFGTGRDTMTRSLVGHEWVWIVTFFLQSQLNLRWVAPGYLQLNLCPPKSLPLYHHYSCSPVASNIPDSRVNGTTFRHKNEQFVYSSMFSSYNVANTSFLSQLPFYPQRIFKPYLHKDWTLIPYWGQFHLVSTSVFVIIVPILTPV